MAQTNLTVCYFLGNDVVDSHLKFNNKWAFSPNNFDGLNTYLNDLTLATNLYLGEKKNNDDELFLLFSGQVSGILMASRGLEN